MKRHGNLYPRICAQQNLLEAHGKARRGKGHYGEVRLVDGDPLKHISQIRSSLCNKTYETSEYTIKLVYEPKKRIIYKLPYYPDRIVHHAIMNVLQPIWDRLFIDDVYSAIPGRGLHAGIIKLRKFLKNTNDTKYCLKFDISSFYPTVNHDILLNLISQKIKCKDTLWLLEEIIRSPGGDTNIPIGNYLSQYLAQIYLNPLDRWIKETNKCRYYVRYGDDGVILSSDRDHLKTMLGEIKDYLADELQLVLNPSSKVIPVDSAGIDFLGYRTYRTHSILRKRAARRFKAKVKLICQNGEQMDPQSLISSVMSYIGWIEFCNGYNLTTKYIINNESLQDVMNRSASELGIANPLLKKGYTHGR